MTGSSWATGDSAAEDNDFSLEDNVVADKYRLPRRHRWWRRFLLAGFCLLLVFTGASLRLFILPTEGAPAHTDAIVMLQGLDDRLTTAVQLGQENKAPVLVVSQGRDYYGGICPAKSATLKVKIICFAPDPPNTRGEAEFVGRLAMQYHWRSLIVVTGRFQVTRGRMLVAKCFNGPVYVVSAPSPGLKHTAYDFVYEWGALLKALVLRQPC